MTRYPLMYSSPLIKSAAKPVVAEALKWLGAAGLAAPATYHEYKTKGFNPMMFNSGPDNDVDYMSMGLPWLANTVAFRTLPKAIAHSFRTGNPARGALALTGTAVSTPALEGLKWGGGVLPGMLRDRYDQMDKALIGERMKMLLGAGLGVGALGLGAAGVAEARKAREQLSKPKDQRDMGRVRITLPTRDPNDSETVVELPLDHAKLTQQALTQMRRDIRRRLRSEGQERTWTREPEDEMESKSANTIEILNWLEKRGSDVPGPRPVVPGAATIKTPGAGASATTPPASGAINAGQAQRGADIFNSHIPAYGAAPLSTTYGTEGSPATPADFQPGAAPSQRQALHRATQWENERLSRGAQSQWTAADMAANPGAFAHGAQNQQQAAAGYAQHRQRTYGQTPWSEQIARAQAGLDPRQSVTGAQYQTPQFLTQAQQPNPPGYVSPRFISHSERTAQQVQAAQPQAPAPGTVQGQYYAGVARAGQGGEFNPYRQGPVTDTNTATRIDPYATAGKGADGQMTAESVRQQFPGWDAQRLRSVGYHDQANALAGVATPAAALDATPPAAQPGGTEGGGTDVVESDGGADEQDTPPPVRPTRPGDEGTHPTLRPPATGPSFIGPPAPPVEESDPRNQELRNADIERLTAAYESRAPLFETAAQRQKRVAQARVQAERFAEQAYANGMNPSEYYKYLTSRLNPTGNSVDPKAVSAYESAVGYAPRTRGFQGHNLGPLLDRHRLYENTTSYLDPRGAVQR